MSADVSHKLEYLETELRQEQSNNHMLEEKYMQVRQDLERLSSEESALRQVGLITNLDTMKTNCEHTALESAICS